MEYLQIIKIKIMNIENITANYNHNLSQDLIKKAIDNTSDWYSEEVKKSNIEFLEWLTNK